MFRKYDCTIPKETKRTEEKGEAYFRNLVQDEYTRVKDLRRQELLATAENPRIKFQEVTTGISKELRDYKTKQFLEQKGRQQLRNTNQELRALRHELDAALAKQQLAAQNSYLEIQREQELNRKREEDAKWRAECEKAKNSLLEEERRVREKKITFRQQLTSQMDELEKLKKLKYESIMKDRVEMQKIVKRIQAEDEEYRKSIERKRDQYRRDMEDNVRDKELRKQREAQQGAFDVEQMFAYQAERDENRKRRAAARKQQQAYKDAVSENIGKKIAAINKESEKRDEVMLSLLVEERNAKEDEKYRKKIEKQIQERNQLQTEMENYRQVLSVQKARQFQDEERQLREEQMRQMAERDKLDQLSNEKRRRKVMDHNNALRDMIETRRQMKAEEVAKRIAEFQNAMRLEKESEQRIEEERIRMLKATPKELLRYLSQGVLRPSDREHLSLN